MTAPQTHAQPAVGGVVVTFFPDDGFGGRLQAIARETSPLYVVDNSADATVRTWLRVACAQHSAQLIENPVNAGIGAALNEGFRRLRQQGLEWVIAFDQDSTPEPGFAAALLAVATAAPKPCAAVGANWRDEAHVDRPARHLRRRAGFPLFFTRPVATHDLRDVTCVITSGTLFNLPTAGQLGFFDATLFLDLVDTDYCLRARAAGHDVAVAAAAQLLHRRGAKRPVQFAGRTWWPAFMPPVRLFLLFRNRLLLFRRHAWRFPHWVCFEFVYAMKVLAEIVFLEDGKAARLGACLRGTWHGLLGRSGPPS